MPALVKLFTRFKLQFITLFRNEEGVTFLCPLGKVTKESGIGERSERCLWQKKRTERVAAVDKIKHPP